MIIEVAVIAAVSDFKIFGPSVTPIDFFFDFKLSYSSISNALWLGQVVVPDDQDRVEVHKFYFKDGNVYDKFVDPEKFLIVIFLSQ